MALDPPMAVVNFLNFIGVDWPMINEDTVREVANVVQEFAANIQSSHQDATSTIAQMSSAYQGASYDLLVERWAQMSSTHMTELLDGCHAVVTVLNAAADYIVAQKMVAIGELVALAASFVADQAAAVATLGLAEAAEVALDELAEKAVDFLEEQLEQYILGEVIQKGFQALGPIIDKALNGFVFQAAASALGVPAGSGGTAGAGGVGQSMMVHPEELSGHLAVVRGHAETVRGHAVTAKSKLSGLSFT